MSQRSQDGIIRILNILVVLVIGIGYFSQKGYSHEEIPPAIEEITELIEDKPHNVAELFFFRGYFYLLQNDWRESLEDLNTAEKLSQGTISGIPLLKGMAWYTGSELATNKDMKDERLHNSLFYVDTYMEEQPEHPDATKLKAKTLAGLGRYNEAVITFREIISEIKQNPGPCYYILYADWLIADNRPKEAIEILEIGINQLGPVPTLLEKAIDIEIRLQDFSSALKRASILLTLPGRKEFNLVRKADILRLDGKDKEADKLYNEALMEIEKLSPIIKDNKQTTDLIERILKSIS